MTARSLLTLPLVLLLAACGDDDTAGSGGSGGAGGAASSATTTSSSTASSSTVASTAASGGTGGGGTGGEGTGGGPGGGARFHASWELSVAGEEVDCFYLGAEYVDVAVIPEGAGGEPAVTRLACLDGEGDTGELPLGSYEIAISLLDFDEEPVAEPVSVVAALEEEDATVELEPAAFSLEGGRFHATWTITSGGEPATCAEAGANRTEVAMTNLDTFVTYGDTFECDLGEGETPSVPLGEYEIIVSLFYEQDVALVSSDPITLTLERPDQVVDMEAIEFVLE
jgi:hypothetical protein